MLALLGTSEPFKAGTSVRIDGIAQRPELNGQTGTVESVLDSTGRYSVRMPNGSSDPHVWCLQKRNNGKARAHRNGHHA